METREFVLFREGRFTSVWHCVVEEGVLSIVEDIDYIESGFMDKDENLYLVRSIDIRMLKNTPTEDLIKIIKANDFTRE